MPDHDCCREKDRELAALRAGLDDARAAARTEGMAIGMLMAHSPGWTEQEAIAAWDHACTQLTRGGHTEALASYVLQTGTLPGHGVSAPA